MELLLLDLPQPAVHVMLRLGGSLRRSSRARQLLQQQTWETHWTDIGVTHNLDVCRTVTSHLPPNTPRSKKYHNLSQTPTAHLFDPSKHVSGSSFPHCRPTSNKQITRRVQDVNNVLKQVSSARGRRLQQRGGRTKMQQPAYLEAKPVQLLVVPRAPDGLCAHVVAAYPLLLAVRLLLKRQVSGAALNLQAAMGVEGHPHQRPCHHNTTAYVI